MTDSLSVKIRTVVKQIRLHDLRHSCAYLLIYKETSINMVSKFLGHSKIEANALSNITNLIDEMNKISNKS